LDDDGLLLANRFSRETNEKLERFFRTVDEKIHRFNGIDELIRWYNVKRPHMSLNLKMIETPALSS